MKVLEILFLIIAALCVWRGFARGFLRSVLVAGAMVLSMVLSTFATPYVHEFLTEHTQIDEKVAQWTIEKLDLTIQEHLPVDHNEEMSKIEELPYPELIKCGLIEHNYAESYAEMKVDAFESYVGAYVSGVVVRILAFMVVEVITMLAFLLAIYTSKSLSEMPVVGTFDKVGGILLGLLQALAIIWTILLFLSLFANTEIGIRCFREINDSKVLTFLYENNLFMKAILKLF